MLASRSDHGGRDVIGPYWNPVHLGIAYYEAGNPLETIPDRVDAETNCRIALITAFQNGLHEVGWKAEGWELT